MIADAGQPSGRNVVRLRGVRSSSGGSAKN
jgi:hypothetical protein